MERCFDRVICVALTVVGLSSCATNVATTTINDNAKKFADVVTNSAATIATEAKQKPSVRRDEAIMAYLQGKRDETNLTANAVPRSFGNFVCAGSQSLTKQLHFFDYANAYAEALTGITAPGPNTFAGQWALFTKNQAPLPSFEKVKQGDPSVDAKDRFKQCADKVVSQIAFIGVVATDVSDEVAFAAIPAAIAALQALVKSLETAATDTLTAINQVEARRRASDLVKAQHEKFNQALTSDLSKTNFDDAWNRHKQDALWRPYLSFERMLQMDPIKNRYEIVQMSAQIQSQLALYDALASTKSPSEVINAIASSEAALYRAATDDTVSLEGTLSFLTAVAGDLSKIASDYQDVEKKAVAARAAVK